MFSGDSMRRAVAGLLLLGLGSLLTLGATCQTETAFVNWENHPVHGMDETPNGTRLLVVNTPDARLEVFDLTGGQPAHLTSIPVGIDPVSVRALDDSTAWVVNKISDSVSVVNLTTGNVVATLPTGDEPADVVFAGNPKRAFVSTASADAIEVRDPSNLAAAPTVVPIAGEQPRALATDGAHVYAAIFESGNATTLLPMAIVNDPTGPYAGQNPPPNAGSQFSPPMTAGLPTPPPSSLIVRRAANGKWRDVNGADWSSLVAWDLLDHDLAILPVANPASVSYASGLMTVDMALAVTNTGHVAVVGTEAINDVRFEPNVQSKFVRVKMATVTSAGASPTVSDLNPHLDYSTPSVPQATRDQSVADPRAVVWSSSSDRGWVCGLGSNNVIAVNAAGARLGRVDVGQGPVSLVLDETRNRLYVLNRFESSISVVDPTAMTQLTKVAFFDPTTSDIKAGRPMLYDAHATSGLGQVACASCHVDGKLDALAWDLGNPAGQMKTFDETCRLTGKCDDWHPMKGPMTTQTLQGIVGTEPLHWRGDRENLAAFSGAFVSLMGADAEPSTQQMQDFENLAASIRFPPNPYRNLDGSVQNATLPNGGNPTTGQNFFRNTVIDGPLRCVDCHAEPNGTNSQIAPSSMMRANQNMKIPQLRNLYEKTGLSLTSLTNTRGFGYTHDGAMGSIFDFLHSLAFQFQNGPQGDQDRRDLEAFLLSFSTDVHAAVGQQVTLNAGNKSDPATLARVDAILAVGDTQQVGVVVKGVIGGLQRGAFYTGNGNFQMDRASEQLTEAQLLAGIAAGSEGTLTAVPFEARVRIGVDRDSDGFYDRDELDVGRNPADPNG